MFHRILYRESDIKFKEKWAIIHRILQVLKNYIVNFCKRDFQENVYVGGRHSNKGITDCIKTEILTISYTVYHLTLYKI